MLQERWSLNGKTAIVTGASRGLGLSMARALGQAGANLVITARREEQLAEAAQSLRDEGFDCLDLPGDISDPETAERFAAAALVRFSQLDVLVNNAGSTWGATPESMPVDKWRSVINTNVTGTFLMTQAVGRHMLERGTGSIISIASVSGLIGLDPLVLDAVGYSTSKGALIAMTRDLAVKWASRGVRVNAIAPGFFPTRMTRHLSEGEAHDRLLAATPLGRLGDHDDLAGPLLLLASDAGAYITGQCIAVDGGMSCR